jgi:aminopeptidase
MTDIRLERLADVLVNYSTKTKPGDWVGLTGDVTAMPALRAVYEKLVEAGANPTLLVSDERMGRALLRGGSDAQLDWLDPLQVTFFEEADVYINILGSSNTRSMTSIDPQRMQRRRMSRRPVIETYLQRSAEGSLQWVLTQFPTEAAAQEANMSLEEYEDFVYGAAFCDKDDPVVEWRRISAMQQRKVDYLEGKKHVKLKGPSIDVELSIAGRTFINADGNHNMPDGEIFTGPVEDSVNGWVRFTYPSIVDGRAVSGIELKFEDGEVTEASAQENEDLLISQLDTDSGSRYLGEFAIGTNFGINKFTGNILFDEKIGGTIHMAIGSSYPDTGGKNQSAVHWDMICDMRQGSEIYVDGELFYRNGEFVVD